MITLPSSLSTQEQKFVETRRILSDHGYSLGGNWNYESGSFDRSLDDANKVWLRLPFKVVSGNIDSESPEADALIRFTDPYVLKHDYEEGLDQDAQPRTLGGLFDQFAAPANPDAAVDDHWLTEAKEHLSSVEQLFTA